MKSEEDEGVPASRPEAPVPPVTELEAGSRGGPEDRTARVRSALGAPQDHGPPEEFVLGCGVPVFFLEEWPPWGGEVIWTPAGLSQHPHFTEALGTKSKTKNAWPRNPSPAKERGASESRRTTEKPRSTARATFLSRDTTHTHTQTHTHTHTHTDIQHSRRNTHSQAAPEAAGFCSLPGSPSGKRTALGNTGRTSKSPRDSCQGDTPPHHLVMPDASWGSLGITWCLLESPLEVSSARFGPARLLGSRDHGDYPAESGRTATDGFCPASRWGQSPGNGGGHCDVSSPRPASALAPGDRAWRMRFRVPALWAAIVRPRRLQPNRKTVEAVQAAVRGRRLHATSGAGS
ncbi:LOW QUALITY PROTEIN: uncharacterized protein [Macaca fascicularis]|uniref:LOW QUALITY PROTEIN: uncharacterized protein n=1 Tax=Macaca fascicularis TaxID=9541 RepID=UPI003D1569BE